MPESKLMPIAYTKISIDQEAGSFFMSCTFPSLNIPTDGTHVYDPQGGNELVRTPSHWTWNPVTLVRGVSDNKKLYEWAEKIKDKGAKQNTKNITLEAMDNEKKPVMVWELTDAVITKYEPGQSQAGGSAVLQETVTLEYKEAKRTK
ncbi:MAG: phage tail protein [Actinomycetota bacterium]|nr:phage tail protein [Actinomycetota bacterium]